MEPRVAGKGFGTNRPVRCSIASIAGEAPVYFLRSSWKAIVQDSKSMLSEEQGMSLDNISFTRISEQARCKGIVAKEVLLFGGKTSWTRSAKGAQRTSNTWDKVMRPSGR